MTDQAHFDAVSKDGCTILTVKGEIDILNAEELRAAMHSAVNEDPVAGLVVSLSGVSYFDSQTLEILVDFSKRLSLTRRRMALVAGSGSPSRRLLDVSGISTAIPTFTSVDDAAKALKAPGN